MRKYPRDRSQNKRVEITEIRLRCPVRICFCLFVVVVVISHCTQNICIRVGNIFF